MQISSSVHLGRCQPTGSSFKLSTSRISRKGSSKCLATMDFFLLWYCVSQINNSQHLFIFPSQDATSIYTDKKYLQHVDTQPRAYREGEEKRNCSTRIYNFIKSKNLQYKKWIIMISYIHEYRHNVPPSQCAIRVLHCCYKTVIRMQELINDAFKISNVEMWIILCHESNIDAKTNPSRLPLHDHPQSKIRAINKRVRTNEIQFEINLHI